MDLYKATENKDTETKDREVLGLRKI
jgi:hypothetical protein